jgi:Uncharacterized protein conserved in bacteria (DUF2252)
MKQSFQDDNSAYEVWLRTQCDIVDADLKYKHQRMKKNAFVFLRATYFRWAKYIADICPELKDAPVTLSVGDTHVENFGTWRDAEGRLVWGINDFDEAANIAYPFDLVRLAASVRLTSAIAITNRDAAGAILDGYRAGLAGARQILLDAQETWMRPYVACTDDDRRNFWAEIDGYPDANLPAQVANDLAGSIPTGASVLRFATRVKGGGSLGRPRYVVVAAWRGGKVVREAKALVPSARNWARGVAAEQPHFLELANGNHRSPDPFLAVKNGYVLRRISADSRKVDLGDDAGAELSAHLLKAMGFDLGSIHAAGVGSADRIRSDLDERPAEWLNTAAKTAAAAVEQDYLEWARVACP